MNIVNLTKSDNNNTNASLACEMCYKSHQWRTSFLHLLASLLINSMEATYSYAIAGAAKGPIKLSTVVKPAMPVLRQGPSAATADPRVCVVSREERNAYTLHPNHRWPQMFRSYRINLLTCPNQVPNTLLRRRDTLRFDSTIWTRSPRLGFFSISVLSWKLRYDYRGFSKSTSSYAPEFHCYRAICGSRKSRVYAIYRRTPAERLQLAIAIRLSWPCSSLMIRCRPMNYSIGFGIALIRRWYSLLNLR